MDVNHAGTATKAFLHAPVTLPFWQFAGVAFIVAVVAMHWGRFVNDFTK